METQTCTHTAHLQMIDNLLAWPHVCLPQTHLFQESENILFSSFACPPTSFFGFCNLAGAGGGAGGRGVWPTLVSSANPPRWCKDLRAPGLKVDFWLSAPSEDRCLWIIKKPVLRDREELCNPSVFSNFCKESYSLTQGAEENVFS